MTSLYQPVIVDTLAKLSDNNEVIARWGIEDEKLSIAVVCDESFFIENLDYSILDLNNDNYFIFDNAYNFIRKFAITEANPYDASWILDFASPLAAQLTALIITNQQVDRKQLSSLLSELDDDLISKLVESFNTASGVLAINHINNTLFHKNKDIDLFARTLIATSPVLDSWDTRLFVQRKEAGIHISLDCSDTFYLATAESEQVTHENILTLEECSKALKKLDPLYVEPYLGSLFASTNRKRKPISSFITKKVSKENHAREIEALFY